MSKDERPDRAPTPSRWRRVTALFHEAVARPPSERSAFLDDACAGDAGLRRDVDELVTAHRDAGSFGSAPLFVPAEHLAPGAWLGPYRIERLVETGGMGEVYRARDTKLDRDVAIKVLPSELAQDRERLGRFEREAKLLASLNHTNIARSHPTARSRSSISVSPRRSKAPDPAHPKTSRTPPRCRGTLPRRG
jgi:hypothetical protein